MSVMEMSHRSPEFIAIADSAKARLRSLLNLSDEFDVLFLQGGSRLMFSILPMNLLAGKPADYVLTGSWGKSALAEAKREGEIHIPWDGAATKYDRLPKADELKLTPGAAYVHITSNETIEGVQFLSEPEVGDAPLVADCSSDFLCRPLPMEKYGVVYACAQKNAGPAGLTIVVIRKSLLERSNPKLAGYLNLKTHADADSMWNTPPTFAIYMFDLVAKWLQEEIGGLAAMEKLNRQKAKLLYDAIDETGGFYQPHAQRDSRSLMNVTFRLPNDEIEKKFLKQGEARKLTNLKGHRSVGGIRASIYNAQPLAGVETLAKFMREFAKENS
jgi:phosphoserine aminotransferase